ncbi:bud neck involved protein [Hypoxylon texense]
MSAFGLRATLGSLASNGMAPALRAVLDPSTGAASLPGAPSPLKTSFTGVGALDRQLAVLVAFFAALIDDPGKGGDALAFYVWGMAQFAAAWAAVVLEGRRAGNRGRLVSWVGTVGVVFQNVTWTCAIPLYLGAHLLTSPVAKLGSGSGSGSGSRKEVGEAARRSLFVYLWDLALLPMAVTLGLVVPTVFMSMPFLFQQTAATHYNWIAYWQAFPLWTVLILDVLHNACYYLLGSLTPQDAEGKPTAPGNGFMVAVSGVYEFGLTLCAVTHAPIVLLSLLPGPARSALAAALPARYAALVSQATFWNTFVPHSLSAPPTVDVVGGSYGPGAFAPLVIHFLQYDLYTGNAALLLWALYQHITAAGRPLAKSLEITVFWSVVGGPVAAALALLWDRDEVVKEGEGEAAPPAVAVEAKTK